MAVSTKDSVKDINDIKDFFEAIEPYLYTDRILELCAGMSRCSFAYSKSFKKVDIHDINPSFGRIPKK